MQARNKKVEEVRLDLDTKRREMMQLQERYTKLQSQGHKDSDDLQYKAKCREFKLGYLAAHYRELEAEVSNALLDLNSDTAMLRNYQAAAIAIMQRCFTTAHAAFNPNVPESVCRRSNAVGAMGAMPCANLHVSTSKFKDAKENADREGQDNNSGSVDATDSLDRAASTVCVQGSEREEYSSAPIPRPLCPAPAAPAAAAVEELGKKKGLKGFGRFSLGFLKMSKQGDAATTEGAGAFVAADPCEDEAGGLGDFAQGFEDAAEGFRDLAGGLENAAEGFGGLAEGLEDAAEGFGDLAEGFRDAAEGFADVAEGLEDAAEGLEDAAEGLEDAAEGFGGLAEGFNSLVQGEEKE
ncbi:hypothetical protein DUNSADRAFT_2411 [Dunaliella salina]|uniref:Uncharacterized protein n=1 Tax=Dunaliella salina TaxID=3046 RepID=A0ABQ7FWC5_DUNSA|nr:hypothetical protein DUNSADRAFT_2411 [Dunaliella salina]|eukprot:KAF5826658.1 hypothetical protein DUNSADRAFT_2411 [Dunaliella salina]